jgi:hypothetical protein
MRAFSWLGVVVGALAAACLSFGGPGAAAADVSIQVDVQARRRPIDPRIYGMCFADATQLSDLRAPLNRWGGNTTTRYNWELNADNRGADWYFESIGYGSSVAGAEADTFVSDSKSGGAEPLITIPLIGWLAKLGANRGKLASFSQAAYGAQTDADWDWMPDAGNGILASTGANITGNDPNDASVQKTSATQKAWVQHLVSRWGAAGNGGVRYYLMDNESAIWFSTHRDVHPIGPKMEEIRDLIFDYGTRVKEADPNALVAGPEEWGWSNYLYSGYDTQYADEHGWGNFPDRAAHGDWDYMPWLLDQMRQREVQTGKRLLDIFTLHYYPQGGEFSDDTSTAVQQRRNRSTRSLWDPSYVDETWINDRIQLIPRMKGWVSSYYPNTPIGVTEYNFGAESHINGATTQADVLGIFGREGLDLATRWTTPAASTPTYKAIKMYRNYNGSGGAFGDVSVSASAPSPDEVAAFAAQRSSDGAVTVMVINKVAGTTQNATIGLANLTASGPAQVWQLTSANAITRLTDVPVTNNRIVATLPAQSITLFVVPSSVGVTLSVGDVQVTEGSSGTTTATFTIRLSAPSTQAVTVNYGTGSGTATAGGD